MASSGKPLYDKEPLEDGEEVTWQNGILPLLVGEKKSQ